MLKTTLNSLNLSILVAGLTSAQESGNFTCLPGQLLTESSCKICDPGFFCDGTNVSFECPEGTFCQPGSSQPTACPEGFFCPEKSWRPFDCPRGSYCLDGIRKPCESGYYNLLSKQSECLACEGGQFCKNPAMQPQDCPAGSFCLPLSVEPTVCPVGYWCPEKTFRPIQCPRDGVCDEEGQSEPKFETTTTETTTTTTTTTTTESTTEQTTDKCCTLFLFFNQRALLLPSNLAIPLSFASNIKFFKSLTCCFFIFSFSIFVSSACFFAIALSSKIAVFLIQS